MRAEFVSLKQGKRTVDEYYEEFKRLSQYAPALVATEQEKCLKFLNGLNKKTFAIVNTSPVKRFSKLLDRARRAEESLNRPSDTESEEEEKYSKKRPAAQLQTASKSSKWSKQSTPSQSRGGKSKGWSKQASVSVASTGGTQVSSAPKCAICQKNHLGRCRFGFGECYKCGSKEHFKRDCPLLTSADTRATSTPQGQSSGSRGRGQGRGGQGGRGQGSNAPGGRGDSRVAARTYAMKGKADAETSDVIAGTISLCGNELCALIDPGSTHSYICQRVEKILEKPREKTEYKIYVSNPLGHSKVLDEVYRGCPIVIQNSIFLADLIRLPFEEFDLILGMDWLKKYKAVVDCETERVKLTDGNGEVKIFHGNGYGSSKQLISALRA